MPHVNARPARWRVPGFLRQGVLALALAGCGSDPTGRGVPAPAPDVTARVEALGNPFSTIPTLYGRNVWDMQRFGGVIHLGHGDSIDNLGPIPIWQIDPVTGALAKEFTTSEEQVDEFRVLNGELYVPGHDPRDNLTLGNFYRMETGGWVKHRTIPNGAHTFDLEWHDGRLFAALGSDSLPSHVTLSVSADRGATWSPAVDDVVGRVYNLTVHGGELYAFPPRWRDLGTEEHQVLRWNGTKFARTGAELRDLLPGGEQEWVARMVRPTSFSGALVYVVARGTFDWHPVSLAITRDVRTAERIALPDAAAVPFDLLVRGSTLYVLTGTPQPDGTFVVRVYRTPDLGRWTELFHFSAPTFARSFEENGGDFFFGLGCDYPKPAQGSGDLLRVRLASYAS